MSLLVKAINKVLFLFKKAPEVNEGFDFVTSMGIYRNLLKMGFYIDIPPNENMALRGIELYQNFQYDHPIVKKWRNFCLTAKTNGDVWKFFCDCHAFDPELIVSHYGYDDVWFQNWSNSPIAEGNRFGVSQKHMEDLWEIEKV